MNKKKIVLAGGGRNSELYIEKLKSTEGTVSYIFDNYLKDSEINGVSVLTITELEKYREDFEVVIVPCSTKATFELCKQLSTVGVTYKLLDKNSGYHHTLHIYGKYPHLQYKWIGIADYTKIHKQMENMYRKMFDTYADDFVEKQIDIYFYIEDMPQDAYRIAEMYHLPRIFCCCTTYPVMERVIPIPNYFSCFDEENHPFLEKPSELARAASKNWIYPQAVWKGDLNNTPDDLRKMMYWLGERYPDKLNIVSYNNFWYQVDKDSFQSNFTPMTELAKYKYLIDIRGFSFYARRANLLQLGRVVLQVDSIYRDWYEDDLLPNVHYVPVKPDFSDLLEKIEWLDNNPDVYAEIIDNAKEFCQKHFTPEIYLKYLRDVTIGN